MSEASVILPYAVACVQGYWENYNPNIHREFEGDAFKQRNLRRMCDYIDACFNVGANPMPVKVVVFTEFSLGGIYTLTATAQEVRDYQSIRIPGPETEMLSVKAKQYQTYIAASNHEIDDAIPESHFNTAFIINPEGKIILKYRKLNIAFGCNPHDIYDEYTNPVTQTRDFFPVVDTRIGRLACYIGGDVQVPEIPRMLAAKGAEVVCHLTSGSREEWKALIRARALDNTVHMITCNWASLVLSVGGIGDTWAGLAHDSSGGGHSAIFDYNGRALAEAADRTAQIVQGTIDIGAFRQARNGFRNPVAGTGDALTMCRTELYKWFYENPIYPANMTLTQGHLKHPSDTAVIQRRQAAVTNRQNLISVYSENDISAVA